MKKKYKFNPTRGLYDWRTAKHASVEFLNKIRESFDDEDRTYKSFLNIMGDIGGNRSEIDRVFEEVTKIFRDEPGLFIEFSRFLSSETKANRAEEDGSESIDWISEKSSCFRRNPYEKKMFECEDNRFEMDMLLCRLASDQDGSGKLAREYLKKPNWFENSITIIKKYLTTHDLRCSDEMIELFRLNPIGVAKEILLPLKKKIQEATKFRSELRQMEKACSEVDRRYFRARKVPNNPQYGNL